MDGPLALLAPGATVYGDGGGKAPSITRPIVDAERVAKALTGWWRHIRELDLVYRLQTVPGEHGAVGVAGHVPGRAKGSVHGVAARRDLVRRGRELVS